MAKRIIIALSLVIFFILLPKGLEAASLYLSPSSGSYTVGSSFSVSLGVNTDGVAINSAQATVSFPNDILEVSGVSSAGIFTLWPVTPTFSNATGTVTFAGGLPTPGYTGSAGTIITISFNTKVAGTANVTIGGGSVLANDGLGTNVLTSQGSGSYIVKAAAEPEPEPEPEPDLDLPDALTITSSTHPEQSLWYAKADTEFEWNRQDGVVGFSYAFDDQPTTTPDRIRDGTDTNASYTGTGDGIWYFHVRAQNEDGWGSAGHYKVQIDTIPPLPFEIDLLDGKRTTKTSPRLSFETTDETSGLHHYDLIVDNDQPIGIDVGETTPYTLSELALGGHSVVALAYDQANNSSQAGNSFTIFSSDEQSPVVIDEDIPEAELPALAKTLKKIEEALPEPIQQIIEQIGETIQRLRQNKVVTNTIDNIIEPLITTTAIITATGVAATTATAQFANILYLFFRFGYFWLLPVSLGKRRKSWGVVFDSITGRPVPRAVVRIFTREFNKLKESQITDKEGRFGFLIDKGVYYATVTCPGYIFPSHILKTAAISQFDNIYRGDTMDIKEKTEGILSINIPIDPNRRAVSQKRLSWLRFANILGVIIEKLNVPLLVGGTILSWVSIIIEPKLGNYLMLGLYAVLITLRFIISRRLGRSYGLVTDKNSGDAIDQAIVRTYNADTGSISSTRVTNSKGQFNALLSPGKYYLVIIKPGYFTFQSKPVSVSKRRGYIRFTAELKPTKIKEPLAGLEGDVDIHLEDMPITTDDEQNKTGQPPTEPSAKTTTVKKVSVKNQDVFKPPELITPKKSQPQIKKGSKK
ncbi:carboxypeptidase regulatory-like domain-containing protein [Patescibacteria group bacterium]|nr:carboxypeptidase regulatory-like domain-containing protein [Patescibacteria group bacterium]